MRTRREFLVAGSAATAAMALGPVARRAMAMQSRGEKMKILILGGTGFLGPHVVQSAVDRGHEMTLFNRGRTNPHLFPNLEKLVGDRDGGLEALKGRQWDAVIDTSGYVPRVVTDSATLLADHVGHYTFISSISVYASLAEPDATEDAPVGTMEDETNEEVGRFYGPLKALCEQAAEAAMPGRVSNIRPGLIIGPGDNTDRFTYWPVRVARGGEVLAPGAPDDPIQHIDVRDLADFIIRGVEQSTTGVYNVVTPPRERTMGSVLAHCEKASDADATFTWVSAEFLEAQGVGPWMDMPNWVPPTGDYAGFELVNVDRAMAKGLTFRPMTETAADILEWTREWPESRRNGWGTHPEGQRRPMAGISSEREQEVLEAWHAREGG